ncbi:MAG: hypothetical protein ABIG68_10440, partial [Acidobacteriota bacterium]
MRKRAATDFTDISEGIREICGQMVFLAPAELIEDQAPERIHCKPKSGEVLFGSYLFFTLQSGEAAIHPENILILDFGSQYTQLIA